MNVIFLGILLLLLDDSSSFPVRKLSSLDRMQLVHLEAAHADAVRIQATRKSLPPIKGLQDLRGILHAHAEDSSHTGGTRAEMLADAKKANVAVILLTNHHRPPTDFITDNWNGIHEGVLFLPGSEARGLLIYPTQSVMQHMEKPVSELIDIVRRDRGLAFLSHIEERPNHSMEGLDGLEIYNRHADAKRDAAGIVALLLRMTDPKGLRELEQGLARFPDEMLAGQNDYPDDYLAKWDRETVGRRLTGVAANDCHHNQILLMKVVDENSVRIGTNVDADDKFRSFSALLRPGIRELVKDRKPGETIGRLDFDPYYRSFRNASTHILATELSESAVRFALREGHAYVSHDWMCDPTGFRFELSDTKSSPDMPAVIFGDEVTFVEGQGQNQTQKQKLSAEFPVACLIRLLKDGKQIVSERSDRLEFPVREAGVYRVEGWLTLDGEDRPWIYSNPIYVRKG